MVIQCAPRKKRIVGYKEIKAYELETDPTKFCLVDFFNLMKKKNLL